MKSRFAFFVFAIVLSVVPMAAKAQELNLDPSAIMFDTLASEILDNVEPKLHSELPQLLVPLLGSDGPKVPAKTAPAKNEPVKATSVKSTATKPPPTPHKTPQQLSAEMLAAEANGSTLSPLQFKVKYPDSIVLNESAEVRITVTNPTTANVREAKLTLSLPKHVQFAGATPEPTSVSETKIEFTLFDLFAKNASEIVIRVLPINKNPISFDAELQVVNREKVQIAVQQPVLMLSAKGPKQLIMGDRSTIEVEVTNVGDGPARNFHLKPTLAKGVQIDSKSELATSEIKPGESQTFKISTAGVQPGEASIKFEGFADAADTKATDIGFLVIKPELEVEVLGPKTGFVRQTGVYGVKIKNPSEANLHDVQLTLNVPASMNIHTVNREYVADKTGKNLTWSVTQIAPGASVDIQWISSSDQMGTFEYDLGLKSRETQLKSVKLSTVIDARPDLTMTIRNLVDPVPVGEATEYVIEVKNHGDKLASDVRIKVDLPASWVAISQENKTLETPQASVSFNLPQVDPKQTKELRFKAGSNKAGEYVVRAKLEIGGSNISLTAEDSTMVFQSGTHRVSDKAGPIMR